MCLFYVDWHATHPWIIFTFITLWPCISSCIRSIISQELYKSCRQEIHFKKITFVPFGPVAFSLFQFIQVSSAIKFKALDYRKLRCFYVRIWLIFLELFLTTCTNLHFLLRNLFGIFDDKSFGFIKNVYDIKLPLIMLLVRFKDSN